MTNYTLCLKTENGKHLLFSNESTTNNKGELVYVCQECYAEIPSDKVNYKEMYR